MVHWATSTINKITHNVYRAVEMLRLSKEVDYLCALLT